jgi:hypothetical protein
MATRPSLLWKSMPSAARIAAAEAFWRDEESPEIQAQHVEVIVSLARRLKFRPKSIQSLPVEKRAKYLAQMLDVSDAVATRALIAYHFAEKRSLMGGFLDALGITHENGLIADEQVSAPEAAKLAQAVATLRQNFDPADADLYLHTLVALDPETWGGLDPLLAPK